jgi:hypothetical protein
MTEIEAINAGWIKIKLKDQNTGQLFDAYSSPDGEIIDAELIQYYESGMFAS